MLSHLSKEGCCPHNKNKKEIEQPSICGKQMEDVIGDTTQSITNIGREDEISNKVGACHTL